MANKKIVLNLQKIELTNGFLTSIFNNGHLSNSWEGSPNNEVTAMIEHGNKLIIGGKFNSYNDKECPAIIRISKKGILDETFNVGKLEKGITINNFLSYNDKIYVAGHFLSWNGDKNYKRLVRIDNNGALDTEFKPVIDGGEINVITEHNGKLLIGGTFKKINGVNVNGLVRLNMNGTLDETFTKFEKAISVNTINITDKILVGGTSIIKNEPPIVRLHLNGEVDTEFNFAYQGEVFALENQGSKFLVGGDFGKDCFFRINPNGELDDNFDVWGINKSVRHIKVLPDERILLCGNFNKVNGVVLKGIALLNSDGVVDDSFDIGMGCTGEIIKFIPVSGGQFILGGSFTNFNGVDIGSQLKELRIEYGYTLKELASIIKSDAAHLSRIENNHPAYIPSLPTIAKYLKALGYNKVEFEM